MKTLNLKTDQATLALPLEQFLKRTPTRQNAFAISVFDDWLGTERYQELSCDESEQFRRDERHNAFCRLLRDNYTVRSVRLSEIQEQVNLTLREFTSDADFSGFIDAHDRERTPENFFVLAISELGCIYEQHWDDTNILWFSPVTDIQKLGSLVGEAGLHVLQFEEET